MGLFRKKNKKKTEIKRSEIGTISSGQVVIKVFRDFGSNVSQLVGAFYANEVRDGYGGLVFSNPKEEFMEEVDFQKDDLYREMKVLLEIRNLSKKAQLESIKKRITRQRKILYYLDIHAELNGSFNYIDEKLKLRDFNLLYNHVTNINEAAGSFFTIEEGKRVYSFVKKDGFFYPVWHGVDQYTSYPDYVRKHKIKNTEDEIFKREWGQRFNDFMPAGSVLVILIIFSLLIFGNMYWMVHNGREAKQIAMVANQGAYECQNTASLLTSDVMKLLQVECVQKAIEGNPILAEMVRNDTIVSVS